MRQALQVRARARHVELLSQGKFDELAILLWTMDKRLNLPEVYGDVNIALLSDDAGQLSFFDGFTASVNRYIETHPAPDTVSLFRGTQTRDSQRVELAEPGVFRQPIYAGATPDENQAAKFLPRDYSPVIEYIVPAGCTRCAQLPADLSAYPEEQEWLIQPYTGMRWKKQVEREFPAGSGERRLVVTFEVVNESEVPPDAPSHLMMCMASDIFRAGIVVEGRQSGDPVTGKALVIGIRDYVRDPLKNTVHDATDLAAKLKSIGFEVTLLTDDNGADLEYLGLQDSIQDFVETVDVNTAAVFAFMGHGAELEGQHYLLAKKMVPINEKHRLKTRALHQQKVLNDIEAKKPVVTLAILDCCREKVDARNAFGGPGGLAALPGPAGSLVMYATGEGQLAHDGTGRNGAFTESLLKYIDRPVDLNKIAMAVRRDVEAKTEGQQMPEQTNRLNHVVRFVTSTALDVSVASLRDEAALQRMSTSPDVLRARIVNAERERETLRERRRRQCVWQRRLIVRWLKRRLPTRSEPRCWCISRQWLRWPVQPRRSVIMQSSRPGLAGGRIPDRGKARVRTCRCWRIRLYSSSRRCSARRRASRAFVRSELM